jgi:hypothetical protein
MRLSTSVYFIAVADASYALSYYFNVATPVHHMNALHTD